MKEDLNYDFSRMFIEKYDFARIFVEICCTFAAGEQIRWLHNGNRLDKQTKYVKIGDGELTIRVSEELVGKAIGRKTFTWTASLCCLCLISLSIGAKK